RSSMRALTGLIVTIDPIGILENYIERMKERIRDIEGNIQKLMGQKSVLFETIQSEKSDMEKSLRTMSAAKTQNKQDIFTLESRKVGRSEETIKKLTLIHEKMEFLYKNLDKMKKNVNFLLEDT